MPLIPALHHCPRQGKQGAGPCPGKVSAVFLQISGHTQEEKQKKPGAEAQLTSSSQRGPQEPAAKANKEAT